MYLLPGATVSAAQARHAARKKLYIWCFNNEFYAQTPQTKIPTTCPDYAAFACFPNSYHATRAISIQRICASRQCLTNVILKYSLVPTLTVGHCNRNVSTGHLYNVINYNITVLRHLQLVVGHSSRAKREQILNRF